MLARREVDVLQKVFLKGRRTREGNHPERPGQSINGLEPLRGGQCPFDTGQGTLPDETGRLYHLFRENSNEF